MIKIGVIGCGHWGPNHIRVFNQISDVKVAVCADLDELRLKSMQHLFPDVSVTQDYREIIKDSDIDAVCIASPTDTHFSISKEALEADKHVLCEKPLALSIEECLKLEELAATKGKVCMVGHVFVFNTAVKRLKKYIDAGEMGKIYYAHSERTNLGPFRYDVNALWDLAPHDVSIFNYLFNSQPLNVSARGQKCLGTQLYDLAFASLEYPGNIMVNIHVSWIDPKKVRQITIVGDQKMVVWDDLDNLGPIKLYDKHVERTAKFYETYGEFQLLSREGSITIPHIGFHEPLKNQAQYFVDHIVKGIDPEQANAQRAREVVEVLTAIQRSMDLHGALVKIDSEK